MQITYLICRFNLKIILRNFTNSIAGPLTLEACNWFQSPSIIVKTHPSNKKKIKNVKFGFPSTNFFFQSERGLKLVERNETFFPCDCNKLERLSVARFRG